MTEKVKIGLFESLAACQARRDNAKSYLESAKKEILSILDVTNSAQVKKDAQDTAKKIQQAINRIQ